MAGGNWVHLHCPPQLQAAGSQTHPPPKAPSRVVYYGNITQDRGESGPGITPPTHPPSSCDMSGTVKDRSHEPSSPWPLKHLWRFLATEFKRTFSRSSWWLPGLTHRATGLSLCSRLIRIPPPTSRDTIHQFHAWPHVDTLPEVQSPDHLSLSDGPCSLKPQPGRMTHQIHIPASVLSSLFSLATLNIFLATTMTFFHSLAEQALVQSKHKLRL